MSLGREVSVFNRLLRSGAVAGFVCLASLNTRRRPPGAWIDALHAVRANAARNENLLFCRDDDRDLAAQAHRAGGSACGPPTG
jgi:hypothetical protein